MARLDSTIHQQDSSLKVVRPDHRLFLWWIGHCSLDPLVPWSTGRHNVDSQFFNLCSQLAMLRSRLRNEYGLPARASVAGSSRKL